MTTAKNNTCCDDDGRNRRAESGGKQCSAVLVKRGRQTGERSKCHLLAYGLERGGGIQQQDTRQASARELKGRGVASAGLGESHDLQQSSHRSHRLSPTHTRSQDDYENEMRGADRYSVFIQDAARICFSLLPTATLL